MPQSNRPTTKPLSVRFTEAERAAIEQAAGHKSLSAFVRECALQRAGQKSRKSRATYAPSETRTELARILALLGQSGAAQALSELQALARHGALPLSQETEHQIALACNDIQTIKTILITALGLKKG
ncbi:unnamed protein product [Ectocarpus sp. 12 AP-2014]